jgi:hypothetical protein
MNGHRLKLLLCAALLCHGSGCLLVRHSTRVVRDNEPIRSMAFESEQAKRVFEAGVHEMQAHRTGYGGDVFALPFICWVSHSNELSDNAIYNDQMAACDANGDNCITLQEAANYRSRVDERIAQMEKAKAAEAKTASTLPEPPKPTEPPDKSAPPALIHVSSRSSSN